MKSIRRLIVYALTVAITLVTTGCSPFVNLPGNKTNHPKIEHDKFITHDGLLLPLREWIPKKSAIRAIVIALHGFNDYSNFFTSSGEYLSEYGIASYAYDQRGFGNTAGRGMWAGVKAYTEDLSAFTHEIRKLHPGIPVYILGESMGGAVVIAAMTGKNPPNIDGVILVAPAVWARETMPWYQRWLLAISSHTVPWLKLTGKGLHITPSDNIEMLRALGNDPLVIKETRIDAIYGLTNLMDEALKQGEMLLFPTLVMYGEKDKIIPKKPIMLMLDKMSGNTKRAFYKDGYHMLLRDLHGEKPLTDIVSWIFDRDVPLQYGNETLQ
ncbi:MAG: lysophospholipase [Desulfuromonadaceae bacterium]|nr:lysophospholipase [Desulfuromonadaceae bacterium]MDD2854640.1 lysophospholipase [Desulfuromonadaceae bacterium]